MQMLSVLLFASFLAVQDPPPTPFQPVGTIDQLMLDIIYPTSNDIFFIYRGAPTDDTGWEALERSALMLGESGNLLMMSSRAKDQGDWMKDSKLLVDVGVAAFKAARAKDAAALLALSDQLNTSCTTCHMQYRPRRAPRPQ